MAALSCRVIVSVVVMMMAAGVDVAVGEFRRIGLAYGDDLDFEVQSLAGERMIAVHDHGVLLDFYDGEEAHAVAGLGGEAHPGLDLFGQMFAGYVDHQVFIGDAVAVLGRDGDVEGVAGSLAGEHTLQTGYEITVTVQVFEGITSLGAVNDLAVVVFEGVVNCCDKIFLNRG